MGTVKSAMIPSIKETSRRWGQASAEPNAIVWSDDGFPRVNIDGRWVRVRTLLADGEGNTKLAKCKGPFVVAGLSLAPHREARIGNVCPHASAGCAAACLDHQGLGGVFPMIRATRRAKTVLFFKARRWFVETLVSELSARSQAAQRRGGALVVRLNVFSDVSWEKVAPEVFRIPGVTFYDYTKNPKRVGWVRPNYYLTFSRSETNESEALRILSGGLGNVTVVFADRLPRSWRGFPVLDGDKTDLRFLDNGPGRVVGLRLKAGSHAERQGAIDSGFAVDAQRKLF